MGKRTASKETLDQNVRLSGQPELAVKFVNCIMWQGKKATAMRISKIVKSLRKIARESAEDEFAPTPLQAIVEETLELCRERFKHHGIELRMRAIKQDLEIGPRGHRAVRGNNRLEPLDERLVLLAAKAQVVDRRADLLAHLAEQRQELSDRFHGVASRCRRRRALGHRDRVGKSA